MAHRPKSGLPLPGIRWRGFTVQIFMLIILPLTVLVVGVALLSQSLHHKAMVSLVGDRNLRAVRTAGDGLSLQLNDKVNDLRTAARMIEAGTNLSGQGPALDRIGVEFAGGLAIFDSKGTMAMPSMGVKTWHLSQPSSLNSGGRPGLALTIKLSWRRKPGCQVARSNWPVYGCPTAAS